MKTLTIGDIHGNSSWKILLFGSYTQYNLWRSSVDASGGIDTSEFWDLPLVKYDKIIFSGDYVDSLEHSGATIKYNLLDIIHFKKTLPEKVVLILGNHDVQYIVPDQICSGHRPEMRFDLEMIFREEAELFTVAFQEKNYLWTHAGVTSGWMKEYENDLFHPNWRFAKMVKEINPQTIAEKINLGWEMKIKSLLNVDHMSGGFSAWAGPLWVRPGILDKHPVENLNQVVGHTPVPRVTTRIFEKSEHSYTDCLGSFLEALELEI